MDPIFRFVQIELYDRDSRCTTLHPPYPPSTHDLGHSLSRFEQNVAVLTVQRHTWLGLQDWDFVLVRCASSYGKEKKRIEGVFWGV